MKIFSTNIIAYFHDNYSPCGELTNIDFIYLLNSFADKLIKLSKESHEKVYFNNMGILCIGRKNDTVDIALGVDKNSCTPEITAFINSVIKDFFDSYVDEIGSDIRLRAMTNTCKGNRVIWVICKGIYVSEEDIQLINHIQKNILPKLIQYLKQRVSSIHLNITNTNNTYTSNKRNKSSIF